MDNKQPDSRAVNGERPQKPKPAPVKQPDGKAAAPKAVPAKQPAGTVQQPKPVPVKQPDGKTAAPKAVPAKQPAGTVQKPKPAPEKQPVRKASGGKRRKNKRRALRRKRIRRAMIALAGLLLAGGIAFYLSAAVIDWRVYPLSAQTIDLRDRGLTDAGGIARLTGLNEAILSGNELTDVSALGALTNCGYIDLTDNPVSDESYAQLRDALPNSLILCEAQDYATTEMALGGYPLPETDALMRVFASHRALKLVDLRGADIPQEDVDEMRARFPHISFIGPTGTGDTLMLTLSRAEEAADALARAGDAPHVTVIGCAFTPEEYRALKAQYPETTFDCLLSLYGATVPLTATEIDLSRGTADDALEENLRLFTGLKKLTVSEMLPSQAARLKEGLALEQLIYSYNGCRIAAETTGISLKGAQGLNASELGYLMEALPPKTTVEMDEPDGAMLSAMAAYADRVQFVYEVEAFGKTFSSTDEIIDFGDAIADGDVDELMNLLDRLPALKEAHMYESKLSQESMDALFDGYPDVFFGWTFRMCKGKYVVRTDVTAFCTQLGAPLHTFTQDDFVQLRYCRNMQALDLCHNAITDLEFLTDFPHLKLLILGDNEITDITPLASLRELEYLEIFMNYDLTDYSPLSELELTDLNVRCPGGKRNRLKADAFLGMTTLERFWASSGHFNDEEEARLREALPDCEISVTKDHSTGDDWRGGGRQEIIERMFETGVYEPLP